MILSVLFSCCLAVTMSPVFAQDWKLKKSNEEIKVYAAKAEPGFNMIKVEAVLHGNLKRFYAIMKDVKNNNKWVYNTKQSHMLDSVNTNDFRYYAETMLPWPLSNRDMIIRMQFRHDSVNNQLILKATGVPDALPEKKGIVRIRRFAGDWQVKQEKNNKLSITYFLKLDSGGSVPTAATNIFVATGPFETFKNLARLLKQ